MSDEHAQNVLEKVILRLDQIDVACMVVGPCSTIFAAKPLNSSGLGPMPSIPLGSEIKLIASAFPARRVL